MWRLGFTFHEMAPGLLSVSCVIIFH